MKNAIKIVLLVLFMSIVIILKTRSIQDLLFGEPKNHSIQYEYSVRFK